MSSMGTGVPNAEEHLVKAQLVFKIDSIMKKHRMRQVDAAVFSASISPMSRRCCAASSVSFRWKGFCVFLSHRDKQGCANPARSVKNHILCSVVRQTHRICRP